MGKRTMLMVVLVALVSAGMVFAGGGQEGTGGDFTPAAEIQAPPGHPLIGLPVDQVSDKQIRIATIMVQNNPFGMAVMEGTLFAKEILKDRNCKVDWISVDDFDPQKYESAMQNVITAQYIGIRRNRLR